MKWDEFRVQLYASWSRGTTLPNETKGGARERQGVQELCDPPHLYSGEFSGSEALGYDCTRAALWLIDNELDKVIPGATSPQRLFFHHRRRFYLRLRHLFETESTELDVSTIDTADQAFLSMRLREKRKHVPLRGRIVIGSRGGYTIIRCGAYEEWPEPDVVFSDVAHATASTRVRLPTEPVLEWWRLRKERRAFTHALTTNGTAFADFVGELCAAIEQRKSGIPVPDSLGAHSATDEHFEIIRIFAPAGDLDLEHFAERYRHQLTQRTKPVLIVLFTTMTFEAAEAALVAALPIATSTAVSCVIATPAEIEAHTSHAPWLWSKYFGKQRSFHIISDRVHFQDVLWLPTDTREVIDRADVQEGISPPVRHPPGNTRILGPPRSGKSIALYHIAALPWFSKSLVVLLRAAGRDTLPADLHRNERELLEALVRDVASLGIRSVLVLADDAHFRANEPTNVVNIALALRHAARPPTDVTIVATHLKGASLGDLQAVFRATNFFAVELRRLDRQNVETLLRAYARAQNEDLDEYSVHGATRTILSESSTAEAVREWVDLYAEHTGDLSEIMLGSRAAAEHWRDDYERLRLNAPDAVAVLHACALLHVATEDEISTASVRQIVEEALSANVTLGVRALVQSGWIGDPGNAVAIDRERLQGVWDFLTKVISGELHPDLMRIARWLALPACPLAPEERLDCAVELQHYLVGPLVEELLKNAAAAAPASNFWLYVAGLRLVALNRESGAAVLLRFAEANPRFGDAWVAWLDCASSPAEWTRGMRHWMTFATDTDHLLHCLSSAAEDPQRKEEVAKLVELAIRKKLVTRTAWRDLLQQRKQRSIVPSEKNDEIPF